MRTILTFFSLCFLSLNSVFAQFVIFSSPQQQNMSVSGFDLRYGTNTTGQGLLRYGKTTSFELGMLPAQSLGNNQYLASLNNLDPAEFYYLRTGLIVGADTAWSNTHYYTTMSESTGQIRVFFNKNIFTPLAQGSTPELFNSGTNILNELIRRIDSAQVSIDVCVYNNNRTEIVAALRRAHDRGVQVRYIADQTTTANTAISGNLPFARIYLNSNNFMHNKFMVVDAEQAQRAWVWTGSMNWTTGNIFDDPNNVVLIQDQTLAKVFRMEFEEMWGGSGAQAGSQTRFGSGKTDNTPKWVYVGGQWIEVYFSPSDRTTSRIISALNTADHNLSFALLTLTRNDLASALIQAHQRGVQVRGLIQNTNDQASQFQTLQDSGIQVFRDNLSHELHHKYAIIDANSPDSDPRVITGSHNWSTSAEMNNDENTLIIHSPLIANWFIQEFARLWCDNRVTGACQFALATYVERLPELSELKVFPQPLRQGPLQLQGVLAAEADLEVLLIDASGRQIWSQRKQGQPSGLFQMSLDLPSLPSGIYYLSLRSRMGLEVMPIHILN